MQYDAKQIANEFIDRARRDGKRLSIMKLLKLIYIAHGWMLALYGRPLVHNRIEAWRHGPVIPDVYNALRPQGIYVETLASVEPATIDEQAKHLIDQIYDMYSKMSAFRLSDLTHVEGGPWMVASQSGGNYAPIPDDLIRQHYQEKLEKSNAQGA